jgi:hypothetical protein
MLQEVPRVELYSRIICNLLLRLPPKTSGWNRLSQGVKRLMDLQSRLVMTVHDVLRLELM